MAVPADPGRRCQPVRCPTSDVPVLLEDPLDRLRRRDRRQVPQWQVAGVRRSDPDRRPVMDDGPPPEAMGLPVSGPATPNARSPKASTQTSPTSSSAATAPSPPATEPTGFAATIPAGRSEPAAGQPLPRSRPTSQSTDSGAGVALRGGIHGRGPRSKSDAGAEPVPARGWRRTPRQRLRRAGSPSASHPAACLPFPSSIRLRRHSSLT